MRAYIITDMVGACGIWRKRQCEVGTREWAQARIQASMDVNAAIEALQRLGYPEIYLKDIHGWGHNLKRTVLIPRARYEPGVFLSPVPILGKMCWANCAILLGFHARAGSEEAFYPQTFRDSVEDVQINGRSVGEAELIGAALGDLGIPVACLSGDRVVAAQAKAAMPWIETLEIAKDRASNLVLKEGSTAMVRKRNEIRAMVERTCKPKAHLEKLHFAKPMEFSVTFHSAEQARHYNSWGLQQLDNRVCWGANEFLTGFEQLVHLLYVPRALAGVAGTIFRVSNLVNRAVYSVI